MATPHRSASIDALRRNGLTVWPGMTIFWIGDLAHQGGTSGHNPDDYPPLRAELTDSDLDPEVRALDFMIGTQFTTQDGWDLVNALVEGVDKQRVYYVIYRSTIWRRATGFKPESYGGNNHNDHVHVSGYVADDENGKDWQSVLALKEDDMPTVDEIWGKKYRDYVPNPDGTRPDRTTGELLSLAREDSHYARTEAEAIREELTNNPPGGLTEDQVRALVREELDKTRLGS